jgi:hypothetical protein
VPVNEIQEFCADDYGRLKNDIEFSLRFEPSIIDFFPTVEGYIQIINTHLKEHNYQGVALGFKQMCDAATNCYSKERIKQDQDPPADDDHYPIDGSGSTKT